MPIFLLKIECVTGYTISVKSTSLFQNISTNCTYSFSWGTSLWGHYVCFWTSTKNVLYSTLRYSIIHCYAIAFVLSLKLYCLFNIKKNVQKFSHSFAGNDSCPLLRNRGEERVGSFSLEEPDEVLLLLLWLEPEALLLLRLKGVWNGLLSSSALTGDDNDGGADAVSHSALLSSGALPVLLLVRALHVPSGVCGAGRIVGGVRYEGPPLGVLLVLVLLQVLVLLSPDVCRRLLFGALGTKGQPNSSLSTSVHFLLDVGVVGLAGILLSRRRYTRYSRYSSSALSGP